MATNHFKVGILEIKAWIGLVQKLSDLQRFFRSDREPPNKNFCISRAWVENNGEQEEASVIQNI